MTIKHHLNDALLMAYSAGTLPEAFNLVVSAHVSMCDDCRARSESFDAVGGAVLDGGDTVAMADGALAATLSLVAAGPGDGPHRKRRRKAVFPSPLQDYVGGDLDAVRWRPVGGGLRQAILKTSRAASARLIEIPPGVAVPDHGHRGVELTLVLRGAFNDSQSRFGPGDIEIADADLEHTPIAEDGVSCICLAATDAPLRFRGLLPRIAQPFLRI